MKQDITFVVPVNSDEVYERNFLASELFYVNLHHEIIRQLNILLATRAYNGGINMVRNDLMVFAHEDVFFLVNGNSFPGWWISCSIAPNYPPLFSKGG